MQQWPPVQKSSLAQADEEDDASGINLDKAKEILREEDKFDKEEYRKKVKEKHRVSWFLPQLLKYRSTVLWIAQRGKMLKYIMK